MAFAFVVGLPLSFFGSWWDDDDDGSCCNKTVATDAKNSNLEDPVVAVDDVIGRRRGVCFGIVGGGFIGIEFVVVVIAVRLEL